MYPDSDRTAATTHGWIRRSVGSARVRALLSLGMVLGIGALSTQAAWTTSATATSNDITLASVKMVVNGVNPYAHPSFSITGLQPGQSKAAMISPGNLGDTGLKYTMTVGSSSTNRQYYRFSAYSGATVSGTTQPMTCTGGTLINPAVVIPTTATSATVISTARNLGASTNGTTPTSENICVMAQMLPDAPATVASSIVTATLTLTGVLQ